MAKTRKARPDRNGTDQLKVLTNQDHKTSVQVTTTVQMIWLNLQDKVQLYQCVNCNPLNNSIRWMFNSHFLILSPKQAISSSRFWRVMMVSWTMWIFSISPLLSDSCSRKKKEQKNYFRMTYQNKLRAGGEFYLRGKFQQLIGEEFHVLI